MENTYISRNNGALYVSIQKSWLDNRLSLRLHATDILNTQKESWTLFVGNTQIEQSKSYDSREVALTLRYKLNATRSKYRGTGAADAEIGRL